jgi:hypothetical protein
VLTIGGTAKRGKNIVNGGNNKNLALGKGSFASQEVVTVGQ